MTTNEKIVSFIKQTFNQQDSFIPLHEPRFYGNERKYVLDAIDSTFVSSVGEYVNRFEKMMAETAGTKYAVATVNGTAALHIALLMAGAEKDTEVLTQNFTFVATTNAISYIGATPHIIDIEESKQIGEFKGQIGTKEFGHMLVSIATEFNNALLVIENANIGWNTIQVVIDKGYQNLYYSPKGDAATNAEAFLAKGYDITDTSKMVPGFTMSMKTRPLTIGKLDAYMREKSVIIQGQRTMEELRTFIWKNGRAEAQGGYNDDLVMSLATACYVRDTALKFAQQGIDITRAALSNWSKSGAGVYTGGVNKKDAGWSQDMGEHGHQDLTWLL